MRMLVVEDRENCLECLMEALGDIAPDYFPDYRIDTARCYSRAREMVESGGYGIVFLDHRMPDGEPEVPEDDPGYSGCLRDLGYTLIGGIKARDPGAVVVGTSALPDWATMKFSPDFRLDKGKVLSDDAPLREILEEARRRSGL